MLLALLLPDPCDPACPDDFKQAAREALQGILGIREGDEGLRKALLTFIGDVANWDVANHLRWIGVARELVKSAYGDEAPLVVDPFAGGGSIPLEALRLGCEAFASDLNPVACLILKTMLEDIPRHRPKLAEELRRVGAEVKQAAERKLAEFYPSDPDGARPIAYLREQFVVNHQTAALRFRSSVRSGCARKQTVGGHCDTGSSKNSLPLGESRARVIMVLLSCPKISSTLLAPRVRNKLMRKLVFDFCFATSVLRARSFAGSIQYRHTLSIFTVTTPAL